MVYLKSVYVYGYSVRWRYAHSRQVVKTPWKIQKTLGPHFFSLEEWRNTETCPQNVCLPQWKLDKPDDPFLLKPLYASKFYEFLLSPPPLPPPRPSPPPSSLLCPTAMWFTTGKHRIWSWLRSVSPWQRHLYIQNVPHVSPHCMLSSAGGLMSNNFRWMCRRFVSVVSCDVQLYIVDFSRLLPRCSFNFVILQACFTFSHTMSY